MSSERTTAPKSTLDLVEVQIGGDETVRVARLVGEIDFANASRVCDALTRMPNTLHGLIVDLTDVTHLDSAGVGMLHELDFRLRVRAQWLVVVSPSGRPPRRVLELTGVPERIRVAETVAEAGAVR